MGTSARQVESKKKSYDFEKIAGSKDFKQLMQAKRKFLVPLIIFFMIVYYMLPVLTSYSTILNTPAIGSITWTWVYSIGLFIMTWALCHIYVRKAATFDKMAEEILEKHSNEGGAK